MYLNIGKEEVLSNPKGYQLWNEAMWKDSRQLRTGRVIIHKSRK